MDMVNHDMILMISLNMILPGMTTFVIKEPRVGYIADLGSPGSVLFSYLPDSNINGMLSSLEQYEQFPVDTIVFAHSGNFDTLAPGSMDDIRRMIQYIKVTDPSSMDITHGEGG